MVASYFQENELAFGLIGAKASSLHLFGTYFSVLNEFFIGLVSLSIAKTSTDRSRWTVIANGCIGQLREWSKSSPENILNKLTLLEAELAALNGDETSAMQLYSQAVSLSKIYGFFHEEALACEKAAIYCFERNNDYNAAAFLIQSYEAYYQWGATAKLYHLYTMYPSFSNQFSSIHSSMSRQRDVPSDIILCRSTASVSEVSESYLDASTLSFSRSEKQRRLS